MSQATQRDPKPARKFVVGNWKMNGSAVMVHRLLPSVARGTRRLAVDVAVCVPFPYLDKAKQAAWGSAVEIGAQDASEHEQGAFTGEVSARMVRDLGCTFTIVGHSERRVLHQEGDDIVLRKAEQVRKAGVIPIVCVGETLAQRDAGRSAQVVLEQLDAIASLLQGDERGPLVVAYEPVWAIGTGRTATADQAQEMHAAIRQRLATFHPDAAASTRLLYGGSVKAANAAELFAQPDVDGALVGGASLDAREFIAIAAAAARTTSSVASRT
jgi:triosephosphate isomerase (TIM)